MNLRPRQRQPFNGFTKAEVEKMEQLFDESKEQYLDVDYCKKLAKSFSYSNNRAGKPILKWTEVRSWFQKKKKNSLLKETSLDSAKRSPVSPKELIHYKATENIKIFEEERGQDFPRLEFEARSSTDGAWYDVDTFLSHRYISSGEIEVCVRYVGFGADEDEWVNVNDVRERSIGLEHSECHKVNIGDLVACFQERQDQARYYDAHVISIHRRLHDIRGCRCLFLIRYDHNEIEERVPLRVLCFRPNLLARFEND